MDRRVLEDAEKYGTSTKAPDIGLHQAKRLCNLSQAQRLAFIAEGLPVILESAQGFWEGARQLHSHPREAAVLAGFAEEEAAKILILMDAVRCPPKLLSSRLNRIIGWFYHHLARLIYAKAVTWKPMHLAQLRDYVDEQRRGHFTEGYAGEYILPNWTVYERESCLYADVEADQDGSMNWNAPRGRHGEHVSFNPFIPPALHVAEAMKQLGLFSQQALQATSEIWGELDYQDREDHHDGRQLTYKLFARLQSEGLIPNTAKEEDFLVLLHDWQIPMYNLDFSLTPVSLAELEAERDREYASASGDFC